MQKKFITNLAILICLNLLIKPFWTLVIEPSVQYQVGNAAYGEYFALFNFSFLLNILLDFGITNFNNKNIAQNNHLLEKHFSGLFLLKLLLGLVYIVVTISIGLAVGYSTRYIKLLFLLGFNQFLISMILYLRSNLLGLHAFKTDSIISVLDRFIMIGICAVMLWTAYTGITIDIMNFVYAQTLAYLLAAILAFIVVVKKTDKFTISWNRPFWIMILKKSFPFAVLVLLMTFYNRLDSVMIERLLPEGEGATQAGIYAKGFRLLDAANMIAYLFSIQLLPIFSRMLKFQESVENLVKLSFTLLITPAIIAASVCWFYQNELIGLINHGVTDSATIFSMLMTCFIAISTTYIFGTLLTANGNLKQLNTMALIGICLNFLLNIVLIPNFKAMGAAYSSLATQFFTASVQVYLTYKIFKFKVNYRLIIILILFILGVIGAGFISTKFISNYFVGMAVMCVLSGIWALVTGLISFKAIMRFMKY
ncbi:MAG TPA: oligosaccharide flippase family protein [Bacteroidia bacterium]|nr:oligosaccharide flippase family protein [Bacteroidia bacterium]